ncbi:hypothetical protein [Desulfobulbus alkaliphilus]|uniref:hypothetical protein n=1 Tax=Desulfobulbus alkaliphilus TaxID=869814 RepID=UPI001962F730|nr:hypothetical protein [Desulfobulbus alkaliphilus]MBM9535788.1 hypothetical protein [Desulfobulbus alkaliphilus]
MLKRFLLTGAALLLVLLVYLFSLLPFFLLRDRLEEAVLLQWLCYWLALAAFLLPVFLGWVIRKCWYFQGTGPAVHADELQRRLLQVNDSRSPVRATGERNTLVLTWRYEDPQWCELLSRFNITRLYELHCRFDPATRTVLLIDRIRVADFLICPDQLKIGLRRIPLPFCRVRAGRLGTVEQYAQKAAHEYDFQPVEIKSPVMGTILTSGWNVRFSLI